jgi:hypothetical protein
MRHISLQDLKDILVEIVRTAGKEQNSLAILTTVQESSAGSSEVRTRASKLGFKAIDEV